MYDVIALILVIGAVTTTVLTAIKGLYHISEGYGSGDSSGLWWGLFLIAGALCQAGFYIVAINAIAYGASR